MNKNNHNSVHKDGNCCNGTRSIVDLLPTGKENAITTKDLLKHFDGLSVRKLRARISYERKSGQVICSTKENGGGYYIPGNKAELQEFVKWASQEAESLQAAIKSAVKALEALNSQKDMNIENKYDVDKCFKESEMGGE